MLRYREVSLAAILYTSNKVDPTSVLPVEISQEICSYLPPGNYLAMKFVNRAFHAATLLSSGRETDRRACNRT